MAPFEKIEQRYFDLIVYGDLLTRLSSSGQFKFLRVVRSYNQWKFCSCMRLISRILGQTSKLHPASIYQQGTVLQREIMDARTICDLV